MGAVTQVTMPQADIYREMFKEYGDVVNVDEMSKMLKVGKSTAYKLLRKNRIRHFRIGVDYKIPKYFILQYLGLV